ncbi:MAG: cyclic-di-AMP receptor [Firmicutes bacterium]|nr:cyclic-di-AMP receptor [Bacillota bacterium]
MKLIYAVVQDKDVARLSERLVKGGIRATKLASTGGFLRSGNTTFMIGVDEDKVDDVLTIIKQSCRAREQLVTPLSPLGNQVESYVSYPVSVQVGGATVFVVKVDRFEQF